MVTTFVEDPSQGEVSSRTAYIRNNGLLERPAELHDHLQPLRPPRLPGPAERPASTTRTREGRQRTSVTLIPTLPAAPASAARATAASTTPRATAPPGPPVRALDRYEFSIVNGHLCSAAASASTRSRARARTRGSRSTRCRPGPARRRARVAGSTRSSHRTDGEPSPTRSSRSSRRSCTRSTGSRSARGSSAGSSTSSSARCRATRAGAHARLGDADRLPRPGGHRRDPGDVLQARSRKRRTRRSSTSRTTSTLGWLVRGMHRWGASVFIILCSSTWRASSCSAPTSTRAS